jgi:hypothetical protein
MEMPQGNSLYSYLKQTKNVFFVSLNQRTEMLNRSCLVALVPVGVGKRWGKGVGE